MPLTASRQYAIVLASTKEINMNDKAREAFDAWFAEEKADKIHENYTFLTKEIMFEGFKAAYDLINESISGVPVSILKNGKDYFEYSLVSDVKSLAEL